MAHVDISSTITAEAAVAADALTVTAVLPGESAAVGDASVVYEAQATLAGDSLLSGFDLLATSAIAADSSFSAQPAVTYRGTVGMHSDSTLVSNLGSALTVDVVASSELVADGVVADTSNMMHATGTSAVAATASVLGNVTATLGANSTLTLQPGSSQSYVTAALNGTSSAGATATFLGGYGDDAYGISPYGGAFPLFGLESAVALSPTRVRVRYTAMFDVGFPLLLTASTYSISPPVVVNSVVLESSQSVILNVDPLAGATYTVTISTARGAFGQPLAPPLDSAQFMGLAAAPTFYAVATGRTRVRAVFSEPMLANSALTDALSYSLMDLPGLVVPILSVTAEQLTDIRSVVLHLGQELVDERHYRLTLLGGIVSAGSTAVSPTTSVFQWVDNPLETEISLDAFSGEASGGLFGDLAALAQDAGLPDYRGVVFFSPALEVPASDSVIQVEQVDVCTRAYDEYHMPDTVNLGTLKTHGSSIVPTPVVTVLNSPQWVLWAEFPRLSDVSFDIGIGSSLVPLEDSFPRPIDDTWIAATLSETWPPGRVSLLNATAWKLFKTDGTGASLDAVSPVGSQWLVTVTGLSGFTPLNVGGVLSIRDAADPANNGNFVIVAILSDSSVQIRNDSTTAPTVPDSNNGALTWARPADFLTADNLTPLESGPTTTTVLSLAFSGVASQTADADIL